MNKIIFLSLMLVACGGAQQFKNPNGETGYWIDCKINQSFEQCQTEAVNLCGKNYEVSGYSSQFEGGLIVHRRTMVICKGKI